MNVEQIESEPEYVAKFLEILKSEGFPKVKVLTAYTKRSASSTALVYTPGGRGHMVPEEYADFKFSAYKERPSKDTYTIVERTVATGLGRGDGWASVEATIALA